jgi:TrmH family RNA methyltransferase
VLDAVQDPGNTGTMLRTAAGLGAAATLAAPGTVDLWNAKVVRSAMGALFHYPAIPVTWEALDSLLASREIPLWGADAAGQPIDTIAPPTSVALVVGNEGAGLSAEARARCERLVGISLSPEIESLNVAVAAGILLHHFRE